MTVLELTPTPGGTESSFLVCSSPEALNQGPSDIPSLEWQLYLVPTSGCPVRMRGQYSGCSDFSREARNPRIYVNATNLPILATNSNENKYTVQAKQNLLWM